MEFLSRPLVRLSICHVVLVSKRMHVAHKFFIMQWTSFCCFNAPTALQNSDDVIFHGHSIQRVRKICVFQPKSPHISETGRHRFTLLWITNKNHRCPLVSLPMTLNDFEKRDATAKLAHFSADLRMFVEIEIEIEKCLTLSDKIRHSKQGEGAFQGT